MRSSTPRAGAPAIDPARWAALSPHLDELLDLEPPARAQRLAAWRASDPDRAAELEALIETVATVHSEGFLEDDVRTRVGLEDPGLGPGSVCGAWTLERTLGTGGMGSVWLARRTDGRYAAQAAIKLPHPTVLLHGGGERFEREGRLLARVSHPHIAGLLDAGVAPSGQPYLVLEYVHGEAIDGYCDARRLGVAERVVLFLDVLAAVAHAHGQFVLHRDLKPSNILVDASGRVKLLDFGIAKLIGADADLPIAAANTLRAFTPDHAAPEQLQGEAVGIAADVYALGVLLYELLAGSHPTAQPAYTPVQRLRAVVEAVPAAMSDAAANAGGQASSLRATTPRQLRRLLRGDLDTIAAKALKKDPAQRYASAAAFAEDLERWRSGMPVLARPDRLGYRIGLFVRRHRLAVGAAAAGVVLLLAGAAATGWQAVVARRERDEARWQAERAMARSTLYNLMLGQMGRLDAPLTQRQVLDHAVRLVESRYAGQPRLAVELLLPIAGQYHTQGDAHADLAVMQLAGRLAEASGDAALVALAACSTVDTFIALDRLDDADAAIRTAAAALARLAEPPVATQADCWRFEADLARARGQYQRALTIAWRAREMLESRGATEVNAYTALLSLMTYLYREVGEVPLAMATADRLAGLHRVRAGSQTLDAAIVDRSRAMLLVDAGEIVAAQALLKEIESRFASGGRGTGHAHPAVLLTLAQVELARGQVADALATASRAEAASRALASTEFDWRLAHLRLLIALEAEQLAEARRWLEVIEALPERRGVRFGDQAAALARARMLAAEGRGAEAASIVEAELARLEAAGIGNLEKRAEAWRAAAAIQLAAGNPPRAATHAQAALAASTRAARDAQASAHVGHARLLLARARQAQGDAAGARDDAARAAAPLARGLGAEHPLAIEARSRAGLP